MKETELAKNFIFYLQDSYDLYYEVADINTVNLIEGKLYLK